MRATYRMRAAGLTEQPPAVTVMTVTAGGSNAERVAPKGLGALARRASRRTGRCRSGGTSNTMQYSGELLPAHITARGKAPVRDPRWSGRAGSTRRIGSKPFLSLDVCRAAGAVLLGDLSRSE